MTQLKRVQVVIFPTKEKSPIIIGKRNKLYLNKQIPNLEYNKLIDPIWNYINLYFLADEEIKENRINFYNPHSGRLHISGSHTDYETINKNGCKKIIATTDNSIKLFGKSKLTSNNIEILHKTLPSPSQDFIKVFVEEYNKGNVIQWVNVEYKKDFVWKTEIVFIERTIPELGTKEEGLGFEPIYNLKINSNNEITIRKIKDSYSREEVIELLKQYRNYTIGLNELNIYNFNNWISENL